LAIGGLPVREKEIGRNLIVTDHPVTVPVELLDGFIERRGEGHIGSFALNTGGTNDQPVARYHWCAASLDAEAAHPQASLPSASRKAVNRLTHKASEATCILFPIHWRRISHIQIGHGRPPHLLPVFGV
jgi:hypothetical protein